MQPYYSSRGVVLYQCAPADLLASGVLPRDIHLLIADPRVGGAWAAKVAESRAQLTLAPLEPPPSMGRAFLEELGAAFSLLAPERRAYLFGLGADADSLAFGVGRSMPLVWVSGGAKGCAEEVLEPWALTHETFAACVRPGRSKGPPPFPSRARRGSVLHYPPERIPGGLTPPHTKPLGLLRELIEASSAHGEIVLDLFAGVGSGLVAALLEGRQVIGCEPDPRLCRRAVQWIKATPPTLPWEATGDGHA